MAETSPTFHARDKLAFLLAFVPYLIDQSRVTVPEAAKHFGVSSGFIRDAVRLIAVSGIPGETESYQHEDLFDIDWEAFDTDDEIVLTHLIAIDDAPRFSAREAAALIAGLQYLSALPENVDRDVIAQLMAKLSRGSSAHPSALAVAETSPDATLDTIHICLKRKTRMRFFYVNSQSNGEYRLVDPLRVESVDRTWYLRGWDHTRQAVRTFRLDRMSNVNATDEAMSENAFSVHLSETLFEASDDDLTVEVEIAPSLVPLIYEWIPDNASRDDIGGVIRTRFRVAHYHGLKRLVAEHSGMLRVVGPPAARQAVAEWAQQAADNY